MDSHKNIKYVVPCQALWIKMLTYVIGTSKTDLCLITVKHCDEEYGFRYKVGDMPYCSLVNSGVVWDIQKY